MKDSLMGVWGILCLGLAVGSGWAMDSRSQALAGETLLLNDRATEINLYNLGNPAGLVKTREESFFCLEGNILGENETRTEYSNGTKVSENKLATTTFAFSPEQDSTQTLMYWINPRNVLGLTTTFISTVQHTEVDQSLNETVPDYSHKRYSLQAQYATQLAERFLLGAQLGYRSGLNEIANQELVSTPGTTLELKDNQIFYSLFKYNFGAALDLPLGSIGQMQAGVNFHSFDKDPFRTELTGIFSDQADILTFAENVFMSGFEYDFAGGYQISQKYCVVQRNPLGGVTTNVTNEITPRGSVLALQGKLVFLENHNLGLSLDLPFADIKTKKEYFQVGLGSNTTLREEGKSEEISGLHFRAHYYGQLKPSAASELAILLGARLGVGQEEVKQFDYQSDPEQELGSYQVFPVDFAIGLGVQPQAQLTVMAEFELNDSSTKIAQMTLRRNNLVVPATTETQITDSRYSHRMVSFRLGGEWQAAEQWIVRGGYAFHRTTNEYDIKDGETLLGAGLMQDTEPGARYNPALNDHALSVGLGMSRKAISLDGFAAIHFLAYDPATSENNGTKDEKTRSAWEIGLALKFLI